MEFWHYLLIALAILGGAALARGLYEPRHLAVTRQTLTANRNRGNDRRSIRVALFSDLHADKLWIKPAQVAAEIKRQPVDLVFFAGDLTGNDQKAEQAKPFVDYLAAELNTAGIPFLAVPGNHDGPRAISVMQAAGLDVLLNEQRLFGLADGTSVLISGLAGQHSGSKQNRLHYPSTQQSPLNADNYGTGDIHIVLVHNPDAVLELPHNGADFLLAGHFHGGQIYAPFKLEFKLLRHDRLPRLGITRGSFSLRGFKGYISRGLGCVWLPFRLFSLPELALLELVVEPEEQG